MATIGELWVNLNAKTDNFDKGMDKASNKAISLGGVISKVGQNIASFMIYDVGKNLVTGFVNATKAGIDYNATLETSAIKWETLLGTQEKANKMLKDIEKFAATTPFDKMGVDKMAGYLHNAGFEGENLFNQLTKFGDIAGAFDIQADSLKEMVRQYSQVQNAGVAYTEDLNILEDRSVPIMKNIAAVMGIGTDEVKKFASEGKITADIYNKALDRIAKSSEGGMTKLSESFNGIKSTIADTMAQITGILAKPIFDKLKDGAVIVRDALEKVTASLSENGLMGTIQKFAPEAMPYIQSVIDIFNTLKDNVKIIIDAIMGFWEEHKSWLLPLIQFVWTFVCDFISNTINSIGNVVESGLAVIDGIINFFQNLFQGNFQGCWESIKQIFSNAIKLIWNWMQVQFAVNLPNMIKNFGSNAKTLFSGMWTSIKGFFSGGITSCINFVKNLITNTSSNFNTLKTFGANTFQALWSVAKTMMSNLLSSVTSSIRQVPTTIRNFMTQAVNVIKNINLAQVGKDMIQGLINGIKSMGKNVVGAIGNVVNSAVSSAKKALGINSPSKVFKQFGAWTGEGLALGIEGENNNVSKASRSLASSVISGYDVSLNGIKTDITRNTSINSNISNVGNQEGTPIIINIDGREVFRCMSPYMGKAARGW